MELQYKTSSTIKLCLSLIALVVLALSGCGGGSGGGGNPVTLQMGGARQGIPLNLSNTVSTFAGTAGGVGGDVDGTGGEASFFRPQGLATDGINLYVADTYNHTIRKIVIATTSKVTTLAGKAGTPGVSDSTDSTGATEIS